MSSDYTYTNIDSEIDAHRLKGLQQLFQTYNQNNPSDFICPIIHNTAEKLIFALWNRGVNVGILGFGYPYDESLQPKTISFDSNLKPISSLDRNPVYLTYTNPDKVREFLCYSLLVPRRNKYPYDMMPHEFKQMCIQNLEEFNEYIWVMIGQEPIEYLEDLWEQIDDICPIDLCYIFWECDSYRLFNTGTCGHDLPKILTRRMGK
jgi:hypothetical protein